MKIKIRFKKKNEMLLEIYEVIVVVSLGLSFSIYRLEEIFNL